MIRPVGILCLVAVAMANPTLKAVHPGTSSSRIINGEDAEITSYPWQISFQPGGSHICGGVLVADQYVVTAAHCADAAGSSITIFAGSSSLSNPGAGAQSRSVDSITTISSWNPTTIVNDYAILSLESPFDITESVKPIKIAPSSVQDPSDAYCQVTGWGRTDQVGGPLPDILQRADTTVITDEDCIDGFSNIGGLDFSNDAHICTMNGDTNICNGDSGGPLVCDVAGETWLFGLSSFVISGGGANCRFDYPAGFAQTNNADAVAFFQEFCGDCLIWE